VRCQRVVIQLQDDGYFAMTAKALVTGVNGFIGRHVARQLANNGWDIAGNGLGPWQDGTPSDWGVGCWLENTLNLDIAALPFTPALIVHCAGPGSVGRSMVTPQDDLLGTVMLTGNILEFVRVHAPEALFVGISSGAVYGGSAKVPMREDDAVCPISPYGVHRAQAEMTARMYSELYHVRTAMLRVFSAYGPGQRKQFFWDACSKLLSGNFRFDGTGEEVRDWIHVEDVAGFVLVLSGARLSGASIFNVGSGKGTTIRAIARMIAAAFGESAVPGFSGIVRAGDPPAYIADITRARALGWSPQTPLDRGIAEYARWFQAGVTA
jgi:UDP-glucose 4-epimerase